MRWSVWLFVLAEFCRKCKTKGTWRGVCSGVPSGVRGQSSWGRGQGKPHEVVALGWNWFHWLSESVTRCATMTRIFAGTTLPRVGWGTPSIFSSVLHKSREWPRRTVGGFKPPVASPLLLNHVHVAYELRKNILFYCEIFSFLEQMW